MKGLLHCVALIFISTLSYSQTTFSCTAAGTLCPCGSGATGEYYSGYFNDVQTYFTTNTPGLTRNEGTINYNTNAWGTIVPPAGGSNANPDNYSTRFSGRIFLAAGTYTFYLTSDDACFFWLGSAALAANPTAGTSFINNGGLHSPATVSSVGIFTADCLQDFKIHYGENTGDNRAVLEYASTGLSIARQVVPNGALCACMSTAPLPIQLLNFSAKLHEGNVVLEWSTATEKNNKQFTVFRSTDGLDWSVVKEVPGAGTCTVRKNYSLLDSKSLRGINYYYLMQTDEDGATKKFDVISFDSGDPDNYIKVFPNPFQDKFVIVSSSKITNAEDLVIYDAFGNSLQVAVSRIDSYTLELNTSQLPGGSYSLKFKTAYGYIVKKLIKE